MFLLSKMWLKGIIFLTICEIVFCLDSPQFICSNGSLLELDSVCNGRKDCIDGSDEFKDLCYHLICPKGLHRCHYGACIPKSARCDGQFDCADKSDESQCGNEKSCKINEYKCMSSECIPGEKICDGMMDCRDGSDESKTICDEYLCPPNSFHCRHGGCINQDARCDGYKDCVDGSDESDTLCKALKCSGSDCSTLINQISCPPILSQRLIARCEMKDGPKKGMIPCDQPVSVGTVAKFECKQYYKPISRMYMNNTEVQCQVDGTWNREILKCEPECGKREMPAMPLVVKGWQSQPIQWPWHVTLYIHEEGKWIFWCGGSLISELVVVTAAHCLWQMTEDNMKIAVGKFYSDFDKRQDYTQVRDIKKIIMQPSYQDQSGNYGSDIGVLVLTKPVDFSTFVRPVCIDWNLKYIEEQLKHQSIGTIVGMGVNENDTFSETVRMTKIPVVSDDECKLYQKRDFRKYITYTAFCAGWRNGTGVCNGDSGGGLVFPKNDDSQQWVLQGIVSVSPRRPGTSFCDPDFFTVFTKVGMYVKWLKAVLNTIHPDQFQAYNRSPVLETL